MKKRSHCEQDTKLTKYMGVKATVLLEVIEILEDTAGGADLKQGI